MIDGFFANDEFSDAVAAGTVVPSCGACGLHRGCDSPKMEPYGKGQRSILIVGEAPGAIEDREGIPFVGRSGRQLASILRDIGINMDLDCWRTNAIICRPAKNQTPTNQQMTHCRPNLMKTIEELQPRVIITLGGPATESSISSFWLDDFGAMRRWVGWRIPCQKWNCWICPTYHPAFALRQDDPILDRMILGHLQAASELDERPWPKEIPDYENEIILGHSLSDDALVGAIEDAIDEGEVVAFDYETNCLKPNREDAKIVSCAVSNWVRTVAFPWRGPVIEAMGRLLRSSVLKIAANMKFEEQWTKEEFEHGVRNWAWDTMLAAHVLDNRPGICSLKFQAFVNLGQPSYDQKIEPYLRAEPGGLNRIHEVELRDLLLYNGLDALLEYKLAMVQRKEIQR